MTALISPATSSERAALTAYRKLLFSRNRDPFPLYAQLREQAPVLRSPLPNLLGGYVLSRHSDCSAALRNRALMPFSEDHLDRLMPNWRTRSASRLGYRSVLFQHQERHFEVRRTINPHFGRSKLAELRGFMTELAQRQVSELAELGASGRVVDLVDAITLPFPLGVICRLFGVDPRAARRFAWSGRTLSCFLEAVQTPALQRRVDEAADELVGFFTEPVRQRRREPGADLLSTLVRAADSGVLDERELLGNLLLLFTAGYDSSISFLGSAIRILLEHPQQAAIVRDDPDAASGAVDELLRYDPPVHMGGRIASQPVCLGGQEVPAGSPVWVLLGSANRDPAYVAEPDTVDVTRGSPSHLAFAAGPHTCVGARLARMEAEVLLPLLLRRFPRMRLAGEPTHRYPGTVLRGVDRLPVVLE
ncbi:cytochrome P450 [Saccharopolyspora taberi]|uniref:Cytochrome P450 n=1 Tax=Saccharopolyspora taberi TaxID=60895 RepID=A0ABN3VBD2_9PSEU